MRLTTKISMAFGLFLFFALCAVGLSVWGGSGLSALYQQSSFAHRSYQRYLSLSSHTYQLFKQLGDSLLLRERVIGQRERELLFHIKSDLNSINRLIETQRELEGVIVDEEAVISRDMAELIETMVIDYQTVVREINRSPNGSSWRRTARGLDARLDEEFQPLLATALAKAKSRAELAAQQESALTQRFQRLTLYLALIAVAATVFLIYWVQREIRVPLERLLHGAEALEAGDVDHRLTLRNAGSEFSAVAGAFNQMAHKIDERQRGLGEANSQLELAVAQRTTDLQEALQRVIELDETRRQLLADVSHELRTPLTIVRGEADLALRGIDKTVEGYKESLRVAKDAADHMARMVEDLLFVARAESNQVDVKCSDYDVALQLEQLLPQLTHLSARSTMPVNIAFNRPSHAVFVNADADRIRQVVLILVENALRYGEAPWEIELLQAATEATVRVKNSGQKLSGRQQSLLFERFYRGSDAAASYKRGTGLGLPVARAIVCAHGAELLVESSSEKGTCLHFNLPLSNITGERA